VPLSGKLASRLYNRHALNIVLEIPEQIFLELAGRPEHGSMNTISYAR
jgi:hypothetical protein